MGQINGGFSVSETDNEDISAINDLMSLNSMNRAGGLQSPGGPASPYVANELMLDNPNLKGALLSEMAQQKSKFSKRMKDNEKLIEQLRSEKAQLAQVLETQRQNFKFALHQQELKSAQLLKELKSGDNLGSHAFQEKLELYKQELGAHQLLISEEQYVELKHKQNQSLKEFIQVKVYETI